MHDPMRNTLSDEDLAWAWEEGDRRLKIAKSRPLRSGRDDLEEEVRGIISEWQVCQIYQSEYDSNLYPDRSKAPREDTTIAGLTCSIKSTYYFGAATLIIEPTRTSCDIYILVSVNIHTGETWVRGCATREEVKSYRPVFFNSKSKVRTHNVPKAELRPMLPVELVRSGWQAKVRLGKFMWVNPANDFWYSEEVAGSIRSDAT